MNQLKNLLQQTQLPVFPEGKYLQIITIREVQSHMVLRTDETTNVTNTREANGEIMTRISMVKRKQVAAERRTGRMLMRNLGLIAETNEDQREGRLNCEYNIKPCKRCPDCVIYGSAIGDSLSIKSRVLTEDALSLQPYNGNTTSLTFNGATEQGNMNRLMNIEADGSPVGKMNQALGSQEHVNPGVLFPTVTTLRDVTAEGAWYVFGNIMRTTRYGAGTTRGGGMRNHIVAVVLSDGEVISNLELAQALTGPAQAGLEAVKEEAARIIEAQARTLPLRSTVITGQALQDLLGEITASYQDEGQTREALNALQVQITENINRHVAHYASSDAKKSSGKGGNGGKGGKGAKKADKEASEEPSGEAAAE